MYEWTNYIYFKGLKTNVTFSIGKGDESMTND